MRRRGYEPDRGRDEKELSAATLAWVTHKGPYAGIGAAIEKLMAAVMEKKLPMAGPCMQVTFMDPKAYPPEELIFEVLQPIR